MNIGTLPSGRELDTLIAEKVMELHVEWRHGHPWETGKHLPGSPIVFEDGVEGHEIKSYSTNIAAAMEVIDRLTSEGYCVITYSWKDGAGRSHECSISRRGDGLGFGRSADSLADAVCLAALKTKM